MQLQLLLLFGFFKLISALFGPVFFFSLTLNQKTLGATPPWALVFRLAHQVALGINFLHSMSPALLHLDLKPSNVLLDSSLNAKVKVLV